MLSTGSTLNLVSGSRSVVQNGDAPKLRVFYAIGLLIVGVLYPEDKTSIAGLHWPPFVAVIGLILTVVLKRKLTNGVVISAAMFFWVSLVFVSSLILSTAGLHETPTVAFVLRHYLTLLITTILSFLLVSDLPVRLILQGLYRFMFCLALALIVVRLSFFDLSREGNFLGLGPLTFARYVCIGWIAQIVYDGKMKLLPSIVFTVALAIADSKGPILFLAITIAIWILLGNKRYWGRITFIAASLILLVTFSGRFEALTSDLSLLSTDKLILPDIVEFQALAEQEAISSTVARVVAIRSTLELIAERPLIGWGMGSWPRLTGLYYLEYPHNSVLEIWFEFGVFGVAVFLIVVGRAALAVLQGNPFSLFVIYCALVSLTTGSLRDLRVLFFFTLLAYHYMSKSKEAQSRGKELMPRKRSIHA